jgi:ABC-type nitrate/sulfonate/bicarbonate transport system substrate-binding protein
MRRPELRGRSALLLAGTLLLSACTSAATPAPTQAPTPAASAGSSSAAATPAATVLPGVKQFVVAKPSASVGNVAFHAAMDGMNQTGYSVSVQSIDTPELVIEGVAKGTFQFGDGSINAAMNAITKGAQIRIISDRLGNEWSLISKTDIANCAALAGKNVGVTSLGSSVTAMLKAWIAKTCPGTTPNYLIIATSDQRALALIANQIDAAPLQIADSLPLLTKADYTGKFKRLVSFQQELPEVMINSIYVNNDFAAKNPGTVVDVLKAVLTANRKVADDPTYLKQISLKYIPNIDQSTLDAITASYRDLKLLDVNGGITNDKLVYNAKFYGPAPDGTGSVPKVLAPNEYADLTYLNIALQQLGKR